MSSASAAVIVIVTCVPSMLIGRANDEGFAGKATVYGAPTPRVSRQSNFGLQADSVSTAHAVVNNEDKKNFSMAEW
jgi:hypothetical protein